MLASSNARRRSLVLFLVAVVTLFWALRLAPLQSPGHGLALFENPNALPRAYVVYRTLPAPEPGALLAHLSEPDFDPLTTSFVEGPRPSRHHPTHRRVATRPRSSATRRSWWR